MLKTNLKRILDHECCRNVDAAVLIPITDSKNPKIVMIKRAENLKRSSGQVAFPGGMIEEGEDPVKAALREANEELGIEGAEVLGFLSPTEVRFYNILICPVVGMIDSLEFKPCSGEVEKVLVDDLKEVLASRSFACSGVIFKCAGEIVWGASSRVLDDLFIRIVKNYKSIEKFFY
ncbi:MAG: CoA pyrophosphatase [Archaeoglobales archaeon]|nr:CoA pyrophosphatase [Archaeoglobales archaeon]